MTATEKVKELEKRVDELEIKLAEKDNRHEKLNCTARRRSIRKQSTGKVMGLPLYDIAIGPNADGTQSRGYAKGILAVGDVATGVVAFGGLAQGVLAIGGLSWGLLSVGGCAFGLLGVVGGVAVGGIALGGVAIGLKAIGGVAIDPGWFGSAADPLARIR